jgi:hypothetical protein
MLKTGAEAAKIFSALDVFGCRTCPPR